MYRVKVKSALEDLVGVFRFGDTALRRGGFIKGVEYMQEKLDNTDLTEEDIAFLEAIQNKEKRELVISILTRAGSIPALPRRTA